MISPKVMLELQQAKLVPTQFTVPTPGEHAWSPLEQERFWEALNRFPQGPWTAIAAFVGSKSTRQAMTHAQKLRQKLDRYKRRMQGEAKPYGELSIAMPPLSSPGAMDATGKAESPVTPTAYTGLAALSLADARAVQHVSPKAPHARLGGHDVSPIAMGYPDKTEHEVDSDLDELLLDLDHVLDHVATFSSSRGHEHEHYLDATVAAAAGYPSPAGAVDDKRWVHSPEIHPEGTLRHCQSAPPHRAMPRYVASPQPAGWLDETTEFRL